MCQADDLGSEEIVHLTPPEAVAMAPPPTLLRRVMAGNYEPALQGWFVPFALMLSLLDSWDAAVWYLVQSTCYPDALALCCQV